jgi:4-amino-4-deoxy-L-arabinose transferase-like glycosyltransferase
VRSQHGDWEAIVRRASEWLRTRSRSDRALAAIVLGGLVVRVAYVIADRRLPVAGDGDGYYWSGRFLADGHGFVSSGMFRFSHDETIAAAADHPPGWILVMAVPALLGFQKVLYYQLLACLVGTATVAAVGVTGRRIAGPRAGVLAAGLAALYPNLWMYERVLQCETLAMLFTALTVHAAYGFWDRPGTRGAALMGTYVGLLTLTRPEALLVGLLVVAPAIWLRRRAPVGRLVGWSALAAGLAVAPLVPWAIHNTMRFEEPVVLTTNLGQTLVAANCDDAYHGDKLGFWSYGCLEAASAQAGPGDASERDVVLQDMAFDYMGEHRGRLPVVLLAREGRTWGVYDPLPQIRMEALGGPTVGVAQAGLFAYWALAPLAVAGAVLLRRRGLPLFPLLGFVGTVVIASGLTIGQTRYRALAEVPIVLLAGVALSTLARIVAHRRRPATPPATTAGRSAPTPEPATPTPPAPPAPPTPTPTRRDGPTRTAPEPVPAGAHPSPSP